MASNFIKENLHNFIGSSQLKTLKSSKGLKAVVDNITEIIGDMPEAYATEGQPTDEKVVYLHYFKGGSDWYIVEQDNGVVEPQYQAFGYTILEEDLQNAEWGYISIDELIHHGVELDLYFKPRPFSEVLAEYKKSHGITDESNADFVEPYLQTQEEYKGKRFKHNIAVRSAWVDGFYDKDVDNGIITATKAKRIIEEAGLKPSKYILQEAAIEASPNYGGRSTSIPELESLLLDNNVTPVDEPLNNEDINLTKRDDTIAANAATTSVSEAIQDKENTPNDSKTSPYQSQSDICSTVDTVVPASMKYEIKKALENIDRRVNGIDEYVAKKLGFCSDNCGAEEHKENLNSLCKAFSAEQVDALAMAIYNIEHKQQACIIGDAAGLGKGRISAGLILYAHRQGKIPVFITEKANLFSDMYRDLMDIGADAGVAMEILQGQKEVKAERSQKEIDEMLAEALENGDDVEELKAQIEREDEDNVYLKDVYVSNKDFEKQLNDSVLQGKTRFRPFIVNGRSGKTNIKDIDGNILYKGLPPAELNSYLENPSTVSKDFDVVFSTYTQFGSPRAVRKRDFLLKLAENAIFIQDESHVASGSSNAGEYLREVLSKSAGAIFLSATFAKRPDNMPIYASVTSIKEANLDSEGLVNAITSGGVALQEVLSSQLVREGQMIRRERSFDGIEINFIYLDKRQLDINPAFDLEEQHRMIYDNVTELMRDIVFFQMGIIEPIIENLDKIKKGQGEGSETKKRKGTEMGGINNTPIFNGLFQAVNQLLFSIKSESVARVAIERMKQGKKPIIAFASTMESFLDNMTNDDGKAVNAGDTINADFSVILKARLKKALTYTEVEPTGERNSKMLTMEELGEQGALQYRALMQKISKTFVGISISPIDNIIQIIEDAGFSVGEVTGRNRTLKLMGNGTAQVKPRIKQSTSDLFRNFNENKIDCLLINQSGSTGASAHAKTNSKVTKVKKDALGNIVLPNSLEPRDEVKQRVMVILQPELNINTEVQKRGRINRTGQVYKPIYDYVISAIPAEKRLVVMLKKKLKSLDANTTSNQKQSNDFVDSNDTPDFLNKYGDEVVLDYLLENPKLNYTIGDPIGISDGTIQIDPEKFERAKKEENIAHRVSGRVAILSTKEQEEFYNDVSDTYVEQIEYYKNTGQYDLELNSLNLEAETKAREVSIVGTGGASMFGRNSVLETCEINNLKKPFTKDVVEMMLKKEYKQYGTESPTEISNILIKQCEAFFVTKTISDIEQSNKRWEEVENNISNEREYQKIAPTDSDRQEKYRNDRLKAIEESKAMDYDWIEKRNKSAAKQAIQIFEFFRVSKVVGYPSLSYFVDQSFYRAIFIGYGLDMKSNNPYALSRIKLKFAFPNSVKYVAVPCSKLEIIDAIKSNTYSDITDRDQRDTLPQWDEISKTSNSDRVIRYIVTGNILQAIGNEDFKSGKLINYTTKNNTTKKGILLPDYFNPRQIKQGDRITDIKVKVPIYMALPIFRSQRGYRQFLTNMPELTISKSASGDTYQVSLEKVGAKDKILNDAIIIKISSEKQWNKVSGSYRLTVVDDRISNLLDYLQNEFKVCVQLTKAEFDSLGIKAEVEYEDEEKTIEPVLNDLSAMDKDEEEAYQAEQNAKKAAEIGATNQTIQDLSHNVRQAKLTSLIIRLDAATGDKLPEISIFDQSKLDKSDMVNNNLLEYFRAINIDKLPVKAQEYIRDEILTDNSFADVPLDSEEAKRVISIIGANFEGVTPLIPETTTTEELPETAEDEKANILDEIESLKMALKYADVSERGDIAESITALETSLKYL